MNENGWTLDEMDQEVVIAPYPIEECARRLELLDEPQRRLILGGSYRRYFTRTKVVKIGTVQTHTIYNVQRVNKRKYGFVRDVYAEMNVVLIPSGSTTQVEIYTSHRMTQAQKWWLGLDLLFLAFAPLLFFAGLDSLGDFVTTFVLYVLIVGGAFLIDISHFRRARSTIYGQVISALL